MLHVYTHYTNNMMCTAKYVSLENSHMVLRSKELLLGESTKLTLCARSAKESKINNQFISPRNTRYSNQQYASSLAYCSPRIISSRFFFYFIFFILVFFHIVLKFVPSHKIHRRVFVPRLESTFQSNRFKFNIPDLKVYSVLLLHTTRKRFHRRVSNTMRKDT